MPGRIEQKRSDGIASGTPPVRIAIDSSSDNHRAAYVALIVDHAAAKPRVIYGTGVSIPQSQVEWWGIARTLRRVNSRYQGGRPILIHTDNMPIVETRGSIHVQYRWLSRDHPLMRLLHDAANALRRSLVL